ncbi:N-acetylglucosamine-6-phosphate deacetylase [Paracoccus sediminicola]|uniref:N-acetylglucosamine-6-phosphate deacetylase n=1 Tax=Paracoccus sediminicola TaxID=3017783 RepID=UPI0022EFDF54|nr:N-acetylglucosamine-6-phosphate deacetylase [Paracoccus sediminicola]WBU56633.1 N-acetylglucosamine-6-phosphate deacetylase [Paracoccus sediminicola]
MTRLTISAPRIFDGTRILRDHALVLSDDRIEALLPAADAGTPDVICEGLISPGFLDLQINGGGGLMVGAETDLAALTQICEIHRDLGCAAVLPTLITDTPETTARVIASGIEAATTRVPGFLGLHLEGPHLDPRRKGAHHPRLIRTMGEDDLARLCEAARALPVLMVTLAPESVTPDQISTLAKAGAVVSIGHSDCDYETACAAYAAGARCATHLFNAMSQLGHRAPGLAGAVLAGDAPFAGLIADGIHVHPAAMRTALGARQDGIFLVTDCMAFAGTQAREMTLNGRVIRREAGRLTLPDGTLAGADLRMDAAISTLVTRLGVAPERALAMATSIPARAVGVEDRLGSIAPGRPVSLSLLDDDYRLSATWRDGGWRAANPA